MDSRERVLTALNHEQPDRTPVDMWAEPAVWQKLAASLGVTGKAAVCSALDLDVRYITPGYPPDTVRNGVRQNMWGERWEMTTTAFGREWEHVKGALSEATSLDEITLFPWPSCDEVDYSGIKEQVARDEGYAVFTGNADFFERPSLVRGLENFLIDTLQHPDWVAYMQGVFVDFFIEDFLRMMEASRGSIDVYWTLTDLGTQDRLLMNRATMQEFVFKPLRRFADTVHREGVKLMFHSCGAVREVIPDLIEAGVDILNPIQPAARGMQPAGLKRDFGTELAFHGGIDIQYVLPLKSPSEVRETVRDVTTTMRGDGGYVLGPSHNIQMDTPVQNIVAMYDTSLRGL